MAALDAYRDELAASGPGATRSRGRLVMRLPADAHKELAARLDALIEEYLQREIPDGDPVNVFWSVHLQAEE